MDLPLLQVKDVSYTYHTKAGETTSLCPCQAPALVTCFKKTIYLNGARFTAI